MVSPMRVLAACPAALLWLVACASNTPGEMTELTSSPQSVDARQDNADVLAQTTPGLIVTLHITGDVVSSFDVRVAGVSSSSSSGNQDTFVTVTGISNGSRVASMSIADEQLNVQEEVGIVANPDRTIVGMLALPTRIDTLVVESSSLQRSQEFDVREVFESFCNEYGKEAICSSEPQ